MRSVPSFALSLAVVCVAACGNDLDGETLIGATCKRASDCDVTGVCITSGDDGLCSLKCQNPGIQQECPLGAYCDDRKVATNDAAEQQMTLCFPACQSNDDCRSGYECNGVSSGPGKICVPKKKDD